MTWLLVTLTFQKYIAMTMLADLKIGQCILTTFNCIVIIKTVLEKIQFFELA